MVVSKEHLMSEEVVSTIVHAILGGFSGWLSFYVDRVLGLGTLYGVLVGLSLLGLAAFTTNKIVEPEDNKWWFSNGGIIFILLWLIVGSIFTTM